MKLSTDKIVDWLIPAILAGNMHLLMSMKSEIAAAGEQLAALTARINEHERRLNAVPRGP